MPTVFEDRAIDEITKWDRVAMALIQSPSMIGIVSAFGYVGHLLVSGKPITKRRIAGGIMLSMFTGTMSYFLSVALGFPQAVSVPIALAAGSLCETGYFAMTQRAMNILGQGDRDGI